MKNLRASRSGGMHQPTEIHRMGTDHQASTKLASTILEHAGAWKRYLTADGLSQLGIRPIAFQQYELLNPDGAVVERSMLTPSEVALLFAVAKDHYTGAGEIVDLGPLLGVGTNALARGLSQNARCADKRKRIHSFDLFLAKGMGTVITGSARSGSVLDRFLRNNAAYIDEISVSAGDLLEMVWDRSPVEILFIDLAKTWLLNSHVIRHFFPCMIPNRTIVIQQDYVHFGEYWIPITMEAFADHFRHLCYVDGATSVYLFTREIPSEVLYRDLEALPLECKVDHLERARNKAPSSVREILKCAHAQCLIDHGRFDDAASLLRTVEFSPAKDDTEDPDFTSAIPSNARAVGDQLRKRGGKAAEATQHVFGSQDDSVGLLAELDVVLDRRTVTSKERLSGRVRARNIGTAPWSLVEAPVGVVNLGAHLLAGGGEQVVDFDFLRKRIGEAPRTVVLPGEEISFPIEFEPPIYGRYVIEFDLVCEMVCWFARNGSGTVRVPITVT